MENTENTVNPEETAVDTAVNSGENVDADNGPETSTVGDDARKEINDAEEKVFEDACDDEIDEEAELSELRRISGTEYGSLSEFAGYKRYLELKKSGVLTAEEAYYAVNRGKRDNPPAFDGSYSSNASYSSGGAASEGSKRHMSASVRKPSSGEVFTRADREELAKWGISATGSELERLWREAGK